MIVVIGAGSGTADRLTLEAWQHLLHAENIGLQTEKLPVRALVEYNGLTYRTLDGLYEQAEDFDDLNKRIAAFLTREDNVTYVVHGHALDDSAIALLPKENRTILPGVSVADAAAAFCAFTGAYKVYTSSEVLTGIWPDKHCDTLVTCLDSPLIAGDVTVRLTDIYGDDYPAVFYAETPGGTPQKNVIALCEADKQSLYNHTACLLLRAVDFAHTARFDQADVLEIVRRLCARDGCPWDSTQTHESLRPFLIEEAYEAVDAIDKDDPFLLADELGDVLLQVVLHAEIGRKSGEFDFSDVTDAISRKMIRRHPTVFGSAADKDSWDEIKMREKGMKTPEELLRNIPEAMPALAYAEKIQHKTGVEPLNAERFTEQARVQRDADESALGALLFDAVRLCRAYGIHPELALNRYTKTFLSKKNK
ncbi:MAG: MazG family protein [Clostridia bacterium]|nr:MazG family protein [Clostridia bacterium]